MRFLLEIKTRSHKRGTQFGRLTQDEMKAYARRSFLGLATFGVGIYLSCLLITSSRGVESGCMQEDFRKISAKAVEIREHIIEKVPSASNQSATHKYGDHRKCRSSIYLAHWAKLNLDTFRHNDTLRTKTSKFTHPEKETLIYDSSVS